MSMMGCPHDDEDDCDCWWDWGVGKSPVTPEERQRAFNAGLALARGSAVSRALNEAVALAVPRRP
ncbi:MAG: hypothetical protein ACHREM_06555 [Polyangiales bacterium]